MKSSVNGMNHASVRLKAACLATLVFCLHPAFSQDPALPAPVEIIDLPSTAEPIRAEAGLIEVVPDDPLRSPAQDASAQDASAQDASAQDASAQSEAPDMVETLTPADVIASVYRSFPEIIQARQQARLAQGEQIEALGAYDLKFKASTISEPTGFYENYRHGIGVARQAWWGTELAAGYRMGRGQFQPWYRERETEKGGEFKVGLIQPLLQGRAIDEQRVAVFRASLARQAANPILQEVILNTSRDAMVAYWRWVAWGAVLQAQRELLVIAEERGSQFEVGFAAGKFAEIDVIVNEQMIAERRGKVLETEQKYREASIKLSLYLRDEMGIPMLPSDGWIPTTFPTIEALPPDGLGAAISLAINQRPEPRRLQLEIRQVDLDRQLARNQILPRLDLIAEGSQDVGDPASSSNDKGPFELVIGATSEVPIQRRKALGKLQSTSAKIAQLQEKLRLQRDKITVEVRAAYNNLLLSAQVVEQSDISLRAAVESLERYRFAFERGKVDLIYLNLFETKANETEIKLIEAQQNWFIALAEFQAASGLDPLDQAALVTELPDSDRPGPGRLPQVPPQQAAEFDLDWQRRAGNTEEQ